MTFNYWTEYGTHSDIVCQNQQHISGQIDIDYLKSGSLQFASH